MHTHDYSKRTLYSFHLHVYIPTHFPRPLLLTCCLSKWLNWQRMLMWYIIRWKSKEIRKLSAKWEKKMAQSKWTSNWMVERDAEKWERIAVDCSKKLNIFHSSVKPIISTKIRSNISNKFNYFHIKFHSLRFRRISMILVPAIVWF